MRDKSEYVHSFGRFPIHRLLSVAHGICGLPYFNNKHDWKSDEQSTSFSIEFINNPLILGVVSGVASGVASDVASDVANEIYHSRF